MSIRHKYVVYILKVDVHYCSLHESSLQVYILEQVNCAKYIGIYIDSKLAFNAHVDAIVKKASSTRAFLARNIPRCCRKVKQMAYITYIRPTVEYASPV